MDCEDQHVPDKAEQMQMSIKICGVKSNVIVDAAVNAGADFIGFNHFPKSPRYVELEEIGALIEYTGSRSQSVVLLVNPDDDLVAAVDAVRPHYIQLHGSETVERVAHIKSLCRARLIKALPVAELADLKPISGYLPHVDMVLLDAKPPKNAELPGGNGEVFDWSILKSLDPTVPFMLSGGLNIDNVAEAVSTVHPPSIDVASGVERVRGEKDAELIRKFISRATIASV